MRVIRLCLIVSTMMGIMFVGQLAAAGVGDAASFGGNLAVGHTAALATASPSKRASAAMTYDAADGYLILFGGSTVVNPQTLNDSWSYAAGGWSQLHPATAPSPRGGPAMAYDAADGYVVLFGGITNSSGFLNDTWKFSHGQWVQLSPNVTPKARFAASMTYDSADGYLVMFGGGSSAGGLADTWMFSAGQWKKISPAVSPPARRAAAIADDPTDGYVVLFGGLGNADLGDTWTYHNGTWTQLSPGRSPSVRVAPAMTFDGQNHKLVLFGGRYDSTNRADKDTWTFHNGTWHQLHLSLMPKGRFFPALAYDPVAKTVVLFGGRTFVNQFTGAQNDLKDTELFTHGAWQ